MQIQGATGIILLLAVVLWLGWFLPRFVQKRQFEATEKNAVRLQQTLRALATTSSAPDEVVVSTTKHDVVRQARALKQAEQAERRIEREREQAEARAQERRVRIAREEARLRELAEKRAERERMAELARARAALSGRAGASSPSNPTRAKVTHMHTTTNPRQLATRRGKLASTGIATLGLLALIGGVIASAAGAGAGAVTAFIVIGVLLLACGAAMLVQLNRVAARRAQAARTERFSANQGSALRLHTDRLPDFAGSSAVTVEHARTEGDRSWQPTPLPRPLYLEREDASGAAAAPALPAPGFTPDGQPLDTAEVLKRAEWNREQMRALSRSAEESRREAVRESGVRSIGEARDGTASMPVGSTARDLSARAAQPAAPAGRPVGGVAGASAPISTASSSAEASASPFASMGRIDELDAGYDDLNEVLRRRRAV